MKNRAVSLPGVSCSARWSFASLERTTQMRIQNASLRALRAEPLDVTKSAEGVLSRPFSERQRLVCALIRESGRAPVQAGN